MATVTLRRTGDKMPLVGLGTWKIAKAEAAAVVYEALKSGYRLIDAACDYGNEKECGEGLKRAIDEGIVTREDVFITSKLWNTFHAKKHVKPACKKQLADWGLEYFDLYLVHFPIALKYVDPSHRYPPEWFNDEGKVETQDTPYQETWEAVEELVDDGLVQNIGASNIPGVLLIDLLRYARVKPAVVQIELHAYLSQEHMLKLCKTFGIKVTGYSSFGPQSFIEINWDKNTPSLLQHAGISKIAEKHGKTSAQVLLRWATQREIAVIPKVTWHEKLVENLEHLSFDLAPEDIAFISSLNLNLRFNDPAAIDPRCAIFA